MSKNFDSLTNEEQQYLWSNIYTNHNFRNKINLNNKTLHCQKFYSVFRPQLYRVYSLLSKHLGIDTVIYDYIEKNLEYILFSESMLNNLEKLYEDEMYPDNPVNESIFLNWVSIIDKINNYEIRYEFYKQIFYSLLIFDMDKEIAIIGKNGEYRLSSYYDYGGVYWNQNQLELENDIYYLPYEKVSDDLLKMGSVPNIEKQVKEEFERLIKEVILNSNYDNIDEYEIKLKMCLENLDNDFIEKCLNVDILKIIEMDTKHNYSDNMKFLINSMFSHSKSILIEQININRINKFKR